MPQFDPVITLSRGEESIQLGSDDFYPGKLLTFGATGLGIAPVENELVSIPSGHGALLRHTRLQEREIFLPVVLFGRTFEECDEHRDELMRLVDPTKGPVRITVQSKTRDREARWIDAIYSAGLDGDYGSGHTGFTHKLGLKFKAPSAFWSKDTVTRQWQIAPGVKPFLSRAQAFFPVILTSSSIAGAFRIDVDGEQPVWPTWTVTGPGTDLTIESGGKRIKIDGTLKAGEAITIDTANGDVYNGQNMNGELWSRVSLDTQLFQLQPGGQDVQVTLTGATEQSMLTLAYDPQHLAGY